MDYVLGGGRRIPWQEADLLAHIERLRAEGLTLYNLMIGGFRNTIYGRPGRDEEIEKVVQSIRTAGKAGLPVIEYNFYAHRAMEGYYEQVGRAGAGYTAFDCGVTKEMGEDPVEVCRYFASRKRINHVHFRNVRVEKPYEKYT